MWKRILIWGTCALALLIATPNLFYNQVERYNDAVSAQERGEEVSEDDLAAWPGFLPSFLLNLGLDLRGGAHLLAEVQVSDVYADRVRRAFGPRCGDQLREAARYGGRGAAYAFGNDAGELRPSASAGPKRLPKPQHLCATWRNPHKA